MLMCRAGSAFAASCRVVELSWLRRKELSGSANGEGRSMLGVGTISLPATTWYIKPDCSRICFNRNMLLCQE